MKVSLAGAVDARSAAWSAGGWSTGCTACLPYFLVMASSSFIYVALADLIPQLQKRLGARETAAAGGLAAGRHRAGDRGQQPGARH